jgi:ABC-2 type transport system ATP-binding protein
MTTMLAPAPFGSSTYSPAPSPVIVLRELTKRYAARKGFREILRSGPRASAVTVVDRVSFDVASGEVFGLLGPNGAGKTTIFKMLSTMVAPNGGDATVAGFDVVGESASVRSVLATVPADERSLNWRLSARENLLLFAALQQVPRADTRSRIDAVLDRVGLATAGSKLVAEYSSGMRQRLLIARALLTRPQILLLDEPTRALDPLSAQELRQFLREELIGRQRCTIMLATHNTDEAFAFCDRVAVLHRGQLRATGATTELSARFGEERYRVLTLHADHPAFATLEQRGLLRRIGNSATATDGWTSMECVIAGDPSRSAHLLRFLVEQGVEVARLERVEPSLADLITRIITAQPAVAHA